MTDICIKDDIPNVVGSSDESLRSAQHWLNQCTSQATTHESRQRPKQVYFPTRLLEIDGVEPELSVRLRVREEYRTSQNQDAIKYGALSHCWGRPGSRRLTTTRDTIEARKAGIVWSDIPRTFQDAITFTHRLGIRYLWLDTLCIIQGDLDDWRNEAAQMAEVYSNSHLTIAAANAAHSGTGIFRPIPPEMQPRTSMAVAGRSHIGQELVIYAKRIHRYTVDDQEDYPLMSRAWAYQERYLAPRVIYFLRHELSWTCPSCVEDERNSGTFSVLTDAKKVIDKPSPLRLSPDDATLPPTRESYVIGSG
jgi:hypothetical protein